MYCYELDVIFLFCQTCTHQCKRDKFCFEQCSFLRPSSYTAAVSLPVCGAMCFLFFKESINKMKNHFFELSSKAQGNLMVTKKKQCAYKKLESSVTVGIH